MPSTDPFLGHRIREYKILEIVGGGGMGTVYKARHIFLLKDRAIKVIKPHHEQNSAFIERFKREARVLSDLNHPNVVRLFEFGQLEENVFFMVMEYITGKSVGSRIREVGRIPIAEALRFTHDAALGLACAHENGIIHRDISPENLMIVRDKSGREIVKVIDFGIARPMVSSESLTETNIVIGKPEYMSPEQCGILEPTETVDFRTDIYSLAVTLYQMLAGKLPFHSVTPHGYLLKHATEPPIPITAHFESAYIPQELNALLMKALSKKRSERHASMNDFVHDVDSVPITAYNQVTMPLSSPESPTIVTARNQKLEKDSAQVSTSTSSSTTGMRFRLVWKTAVVVFVISGSFWLFLSTTPHMGVAPVSEPRPTFSKPAPPVPEPKVSAQGYLAEFQNAERVFHSKNQAASVDLFRNLIDRISKEEPPLSDQETSLLMSSLDYLGQAYYADAQIDQARSAFIRLLELEPAYRIDESTSSNKVVRFLEQTRTENVGVISVTSNPPDATIMLDGEKVGTTNDKAIYIFKGTHTLEVERTGFTPKVQTISVVPGKSKNYHFVLDANNH